MKNKTNVLILIMALIMVLTSCQKVEQKRYEAQFISLFDTVTTVVSYGGSKSEFENNVTFIHDKLKKLHQLYNIYEDYDGINNIKTINDKAGISPVKVDKHIISMLLFSKNLCFETEGKVNIALGSVLSIWHTFRENGIDDPLNATLPPKKLLMEAARHTDIDKVIIDEEASTVYLSDKEMKLDVGAIGKGYAASEVAAMAEKKGFSSGLISVGGNVCAISGKYGDDTPWTIGIKNPDKEIAKENVAIVNLVDSSLVSSGDYQRYFTVDGKQYHHIINPDTLMPANYYRSVSIIAKNSGIADGLSTAVFNMPLNEAKVFMEKFPDTEACFILPNGDIEYTSGFKSYLK